MCSSAMIAAAVGRSTTKSGMTAHQRQFFSVMYFAGTRFGFTTHPHERGRWLGGQWRLRYLALGLHAP